MQKELIGLTVHYLSLRGGNVKVVADDSGNSIGNTPRPSMMVQAMVVDNTGGSAATLKKEKGQISMLNNVEAFDSVLYNHLRSNVPRLAAHDGLQIYCHKNGNWRSFPATQQLQATNNTSVVIPPFNDGTTYQAHIGQLTMIILAGMAWQIMVSVLYVLLFMATIGTLHRTIMLNNVLLESKRSFTRNITHELKIPITTLLVAAEGIGMLDAPPQPFEIHKYTGIIKRAANQLSILVDTILAHSMADERKVPIVFRTVNLKELINDALAELSPILAMNGAEVFIESVAPDINIKGDHELLKRVIINIIDNAVKYSVRRSKIQITAGRYGRRVILKITDNGIGIARKYFRKVFEPYFRIGNEDIHDVKGYGLGLSYVRQIIKLVNGDISVAASGPEGTTIQIILPAYES